MDTTTERRAEAAYAEFRRTRGPRALADVFDLLAAELLVYARRLLRDAAAAEDLVQQTFVRAIEGAATFDPQRRLLPWLMAILTNEARMLHRRAVRAGDVPAPPPPETPPEAAERRELAQAVDAALGEMPPSYRDVVALRYLHGLRPRHIAAALALPVATVKTRLQRGVQRLAANLPRSVALGVVLASLAGPGLAATRRRVLAQAAPCAGGVAVVSLGGVLIMKKTVLAALATCLLLAVWWTADPAEPERHSAASVASTPTRASSRGLPETDAGVGAGRMAVTHDAEEPEPAEAVVAIDVRVQAIWKGTREPASHLPLQLQAPNDGVLAEQWTDAAGTARFTLAAHPRHFEGTMPRFASVAFGGAPGRSIGFELTGSTPRVLLEIEDGVRVRGAVVDEHGAPIAGADIWSAGFHADRVLARTDVHGEFSLRGLAADAKVRATAAGAASAITPIVELDGASRLVLRLARSGSALEVRLRAGNEPVVGAAVQVLSEARQQGGSRVWTLRRTTDGQGVARWEGLAAGAYIVEVAPALQPPAQRSCRVAASDGVHTETIQLGGTATVHVHAVRRKRPLAGIEVCVEDVSSLLYRSARTDADGRCTLRNVAVGRVGLRLEGGSVRTGRVVELVEGEQAVAFEIPGGGDLRGRLLLPDGGPAGGWLIAARCVDDIQGASHAQTDASGAFLCVNVSAKEHRLEVCGPADRGGAHVFHGVFAGGQDADFRLPTSATWRPARWRARFAGAPAGCTLVHDLPFRANVGVVLDADLACAIELQPGSRRLRLLSDQGAVLWLTAVELADGEAQDAGVVTLPAWGSVAVHLQPGEGVDPAGLHMSLRSPMANDGYADGSRLQRGPEGAWRAERVPVGRWWLCAAGDGIAPDAREIVVEANRETRQDMALSRVAPTRFRLAPADPAVEFVGWCRVTVRRAMDRAVVAHREGCGPLEFGIELGSGEHTIDVQTGAGWNGAATFRVPAVSPVPVPLLRDR